MPSLRKEFNRTTEQQIYFYSVAKFLQLASHYLNIKVSEESLVDAREIAKQDVNLSVSEKQDIVELSGSINDELLQDINNPQENVWPIVESRSNRTGRLLQLVRTRERAYKSLADKKRISDNLREKWMEYPREVRGMEVKDMPQDARTAALVYFNSRRIIKNAEEKYEEANTALNDFLRSNPVRR